MIPVFLCEVIDSSVCMFLIYLRSEGSLQLVIAFWCLVMFDMSDVHKVEFV